MQIGGNERIGDEQIHTNFPLVQRLQGQLAKVSNQDD